MGRGKYASLCQRLYCDEPAHDEKMVMANLKFSAKLLMSHESIKNNSIENMCFEALVQKGRRREPSRFEAYFLVKLNNS